MDSSTFAVLAHTKPIGSADATVQCAEGAILLFNTEKAVPLSVWFVSKVAFSVLSCLLHFYLLFLLLSVAPFIVAILHIYYLL